MMVWAVLSRDWLVQRRSTIGKDLLAGLLAAIVALP